MAPKILMLHSSVYGHSCRICERLCEQFVARGFAATVAPIADPGVDPAAHDVVVVGASIRQGKHHPAVLDFIRRHLDTLRSRPGALFSVNLVARKPAKNRPETNPYLQRFVAVCPWRPQLLGVFAGELDYSRYGRFEKQLMRFVMKINRGPTDPGAHVCFTDWDEVARFGERVMALAAGRADEAAPRTAAAAASPAAVAT